MSVTHCPICGCGDLRRDEVWDRELVLLAECPRCQHRVAERLARSPRAALRVGFEAAEEGVAA